MSDNIFEPDSLEMPKAADLRRAVEAVLLYRDQDISGVGMVLDEAAAAHRTTHVIAALLYLLNRELDNQARHHGEEAVVSALRNMIASIAATEEDD